MKGKIFAAMLLLTCALFAACGGDGRTAASGEAQPAITLYAAAGMTEAIADLGSLFEEETGVPIRYNFASSGALAQQLLASPRADVFISANERWMDLLQAEGAVDPDTRRIVAGNQLVVIARKDSSWQLEDPRGLVSLNFTHLSIGDPEYVPAGQYAREWLSSLPGSSREGSLWDALKDRMVPAPDVRAALAQVIDRRGMLGIVYRSDYLAKKDRLDLLYTVPIEENPQIRFSAAAITSSAQISQALRFLDFLGTPEAIAILEHHGFAPPPSPKPRVTNLKHES